jgi:hypothetical protein
MREIWHTGVRPCRSLWNKLCAGSVEVSGPRILIRSQGSRTIFGVPIEHLQPDLKDPADLMQYFALVTR